MQLVDFINKHNRTFRPSKPGDVGHDLYSNNDLIVWPFQTKMIETGIFLDQPSSLWCMIVARSSTTRKHLMVFQGIIDSGYQGELFVVVRNLSLIPRRIRKGERYAQAIFFPATRPDMYEVKQFAAASVRGDTGFGSSGQ
jgi:dUTP pyrophosphatase